MLITNKPAERYQRQSMIPGWNQEALGKSSLVVIGPGPEAVMCITGATALGVGEVTWVTKEAVANQLTDFLHQLNPAVEFSIVPDAPDGSDTCWAILCNPHCAHQLEIAYEVYGSNFVGSLFFDVFVPGFHKDLGQDKHALGVDTTKLYAGAFACVRAGVALSVFVSRVLSLEEDPNHLAKVYYNLSLTRPLVAIMEEGEAYAPGLESMRVAGTPSCGDKDILLAGAGAVGTWAAIALMLTPPSWDNHLLVFDPDTVAETNLNRQILFADQVGKPKAPALVKALEMGASHPLVAASGVSYKGTWQAVPFVEPFTKAKLSEDVGKNVGMLVSAVDRFSVRADMNKAALAAGIPLLNAGSSAIEAEAMVTCVTDQAPCLNCMVEIDRLAEIEPIAAAACGNVPEPSIVVTNMVAGGLLAGELIAHLRGMPPPDGILAFDSTSPYRVGMKPIPKVECKCGQS